MRLSRYRKLTIAFLMLGTSAIALALVLKAIAVWLYLFGGVMYVLAVIAATLELIGER